MFSRSVALAVLLMSAPVWQPAPGRVERSPRNASYTIGARLDAAARTVTGRAIIVWRNTAATPAPSLRFHLYYNAWRDDRSTFMRESRLSGPPARESRPGDRGSIEIGSLAVVVPGAAAADLTSRIRFVAPDDGNPDDRTVAEVPLDRAIAPGETATIDVTWTSRVPRPVARTGVIGQSYFIAQWFPKLGVFEDTGWNCHQFHAATEFFADFGVYDVSLTVPGGWIVGATGREGAGPAAPDARVATTASPGETTHRYYAEDVHDFAWTASPDYVVSTARFEHARLPPVDLRLLMRPEHVGQEARHFDAARAALQYYGEWFGPYPYGYLTIVDPAWQSAADGMEYPTLITAGTSWLAPGQTGDPEDVTVHETGHQFWHGVVATNEFEHAWMDEGLTTFTTARVMAERFEPLFWQKRYFGGFVPWVFRDVRLTRESSGNRMPGYRRTPTADIPSMPTWRYFPGTAGVTTYNKTALWLNTLERLLGWDVLQRILSTYYGRYAFAHPRPEDFFAVVNEVSGRDMTWFFDQVYRRSNAFDYGVDRFTSERLPGGGYRTTVVARRYGEGEFPVDVRVRFENGEDVRWRWDGRERWTLFQIDKAVRAETAEVDPDRVLLLDINSTNNSATVAPKAHAAARKWSLVWLVWLQDHLLTYGLFV